MIRDRVSNRAESVFSLVEPTSHSHPCSHSSAPKIYNGSTGVSTLISKDCHERWFFCLQENYLFVLGACWLSTEMGALGVSIKRLSGVLPNINTHSRPEGRFPNGFPQPHSALVLKPRLKPFFFFFNTFYIFPHFPCPLTSKKWKQKKAIAPLNWWKTFNSAIFFLSNSFFPLQI